jgi:hypothetical protein
MNFNYASTIYGVLMEVCVTEIGSSFFKSILRCFYFVVGSDFGAFLGIFTDICFRFFL